MERRGRYLVLGVTAVVVLAAAAFLLFRQLAITSAIDNTGEMSFNVRGATADCDDPDNPTKCVIDEGDTFTLSVSANALPPDYDGTANEDGVDRDADTRPDPGMCDNGIDDILDDDGDGRVDEDPAGNGDEDGDGLVDEDDSFANGGAGPPDGADIMDLDCLASDRKVPYIGIQTAIFFGPNLAYQPTDLFAEEIVWPDSAFALRTGPEDPGGIEGRVNHADATGFTPPFPESTHVGDLVQITLTCTPSPSLNEVLLLSFDDRTDFFIDPATTFRIDVWSSNTSGAGFKLPDDTKVPAKYEEERNLDVDGDGEPDARTADNDPGFGVDLKEARDPQTGERWLIDYRIADALTISCGPKPPTPTPTETPSGPSPTPTEGPSPTPTETPGGPTSTPAGPTPTSPPVGPTPTRGPTPTPCPGCLNMSLGATGNVICNDADSPTICAVPFLPGREKAAEFTITVNINAIPDGGYGGFAAEVFFGGLAYNQDPCTEEVVWPDEFLCTQFVGPGGQRQLVSRTDIFPPLAKSNYVGRLVELDVHCPSEDQFKLTLTAAPGSEFGAAVVEPDGDPVYPDPAGQQQVDLDGDTMRETVDAADALLISCVLPPADVNGDGAVDSLDASITLQYLAGLLDPAPDTGRMDANGDGSVNAIDVTLVLQFDAGLINVIPRSGAASAAQSQRYRR